ncbi:hypothetical protein ACA910_009656 [Epithemia clementina (nom. ined.)]
MEEEESSAIGTTPSSASDESSSSSSSSFRLSSDDNDKEDCRMPAKPSPKLAANKATDTTSDGKNSPSLIPKKLGVVVTDEKKKKDKVESSSLSCGAISIGSNNDSYSVRMEPSAATTAEDGPLRKPEPLIVTNVHDDLIPRLQDGTRLIGLKAIPFNSSTFQDDDLEEMLLLVFPTVPSESTTTATPTITLEHKKKLQESLLKLKSEVTTVVSDEIKSMIVRKAQQLKMSIDREEGHRLVTNWLEILDNWQSDLQDNNFL